MEHEVGAAVDQGDASGFKGPEDPVERGDRRREGLPGLDADLRRRRPGLRDERDGSPSPSMFGTL